MRNGLKLFWIVAMFATMGFLMMGCDNGNNGGPQIIRHEGVAPDGTIFVLIITDGTNFELRVGTSANEAISTGTATLTGGVWSLTPVVNGTPAETFTITVGSDGITNIEGTITFENAPPQQAPPSITPVPPTPPGGGNNNQPTPGTPISITITGIPAEHNNMGALLALFNTDMEPIAISDGGTPAIITAGNMSKSLYHWIVLPNGDYGRGEPFGTAGDYVIWVVIFGDDYYEFVYETSRFINYGSNTIPFANNFQPLPTDERPTVAPEPITITIDGIPSDHNGLVGVIYLSTSPLGNADFDVVATSNDDTITNGSITLTFYDGYGVPFITAGDYYVLFWVYTVDWDDYGNILDALLYGTARRRINYGTNPIPFTNNFQPINWEDYIGDNNGNGNYPPGTPITITIDGLEAYNGWYGSVILSTAFYDGIMDGEAFWIYYAVAISQEMVITNGYVSLALLYELPDGETEPFATAGDYYVLLQVNIDDEEEWVFFLYGTAQSRINYGTNPIPFASNFQPITLDW